MPATSQSSVTVTGPTRAFVNSVVLLWARESAGFTAEDAAKKIGVKPERLISAESGATYLTLRQAEVAAELYGRPLATLFLPEPPSEPSATTQYRQFPDVPPLPWPPSVALLTRRIQQRQDDARELYELLEEPPPWIDSQFVVHEDATESAHSVRRALDITVREQQSWRDRAGFKGLRQWVSGIEKLGIMVVQESTWPIELFRGLASPDEIVPAIIIHTKDVPGARAFTLMHELGHVLRAREPAATRTHAEQWCNVFAAEVLMPREAFVMSYSVAMGDYGILLEVADSLALSYGVTAAAAAVRMGDLELIRGGEIAELRTAISGRYQAQQEDSSTGGDYYRSTVSRLSRGFAGLVFAALDAQMLTYPKAAALLNVKVNNFARLRDALGSGSV